MRGRYWDITHLVIGHDRNLGFSNVKKKAS
jgi:hypothetical protein